MECCFIFVNSGNTWRHKLNISDFFPRIGLLSISFGNIFACIINMSGLLSAVIMVWALEKNLSIKNWYLNVTKIT